MRVSWALGALSGNCSKDDRAPEKRKVGSSTLPLTTTTRGDAVCPFTCGNGRQYGIRHGTGGGYPRLASMLTIFSRLAAGEEMPAREKTRVRRGAAGSSPSAPHPAVPAPGQSPPAGAPPVPAAGLAAGHAGAGGRHLRRTAHRRAGPHRQRPQDLRPADGIGVPLAFHPAACRPGQTLMRCARKYRRGGKTGPPGGARVAVGARGSGPGRPLGAGG